MVQPMPGRPERRHATGWFRQKHRLPPSGERPEEAQEGFDSEGKDMTLRDGFVALYLAHEYT